MTEGNRPALRATVTIDGHETTTAYPLGTHDLRVADWVLSHAIGMPGMTGGGRHYEIRRHTYEEGSPEARIDIALGLAEPGEVIRWSILWNLAEHMWEEGSPAAARLFRRLDEGDDALIVDIDPYEQAA